MLPDAIRYKLQFGPYRTPRFDLGALVGDEIRGEVKIVGISDARIPWPLSMQWTRRSLVIYDALARAIRLESSQAVTYWWGLSIETVRLLRRALGIGANNEGTASLRRRYCQSPAFRRALRKAWANAGSPERREKNRRGHLGKTLPESARQKMLKARIGYVHSAETRRKISETLKRNGTWRPWSAEDDAILQSLSSDGEVAEFTGRTRSGVYHRRKRLASASDRQLR